MVVYDLGGGTFDTAAVSLVDRRFSLIASEGVGKLGGEDFDCIILELALEEAGVARASLDRVTQARLLELCREAKEALNPSSRRLLVDLSLVLSGNDPVTLELTAINEACAPLVQRTIALLAKVLDRVRDYGIDPENPRELGGVYLVGGATAFPVVGRLLRERYGRKVLLAPQPHAATAIGLAIAADPEAGVFVREAATRHFGVWRESEAGRMKVFDPIIDKGLLGNESGLAVERSYRPMHAVGRLRFLECTQLGEDGRPDGDLTPWGEILFPYDPELAQADDLAKVPGERRIDPVENIVEHYEYRSDGRVVVSIENATRGYRRRYVLGAQRCAALGV